MAQNKDNIQIKFATIMKWIGFDGPSSQNINRLDSNLQREKDIADAKTFIFLDALHTLCREFTTPEHNRNIKLVLNEFSVVDNYLKSTSPVALDTLRLIV